MDRVADINHLLIRGDPVGPGGDGVVEGVELAPDAQALLPVALLHQKLKAGKAVILKQSKNRTSIYNITD